MSMIDGAEASFLETSPHPDKRDDVQLFDLFLQQELLSIKNQSKIG